MITTLDEYITKETKEPEKEYKYYNEPQPQPKYNEYAFEDIVELTKMVRKDLKTKYGKTIKFSVTSNRYPREINIRIKGISKEYLIPEREFEEIMYCSYRYSEDMYDEYMKPYREVTEDGLRRFQVYHLREEVAEDIRHILNKYNYDNSDPYTDYFDVNYYTSFECKWSGVMVFE